MTPAKLMLSVCISVLLEGISGDVTLFYSPGQTADLPCIGGSPSDSSFGSGWFYNRDPNHPEDQIKNGQVVPNSPRASRMILGVHFNLIIRNLTADDAGAYTCRLKDKDSTNSNVFVNILAISLFPLDAKPRADGSMTLQCTLSRYGGYSPCTQNNLLWVDDTGTPLFSEHNVYNARNVFCVSKLTVRPSGFNRRYTCHFVETSNTMIYAEYTPVVIGDNATVPVPCTGWTSLIIFTWILRVTGVLLMIVISVHFLRNKVSMTCGRQGNNGHQAMTYENVGSPAATSNLHRPARFNP